MTETMQAVNRDKSSPTQLVQKRKTSDTQDES